MATLVRSALVILLLVLCTKVWGGDTTFSVNDTLTLSWDPNKDEVIGYKVYAGALEGGKHLVGKVLHPTTKWVVDLSKVDIPPGTYWLAITAYNDEAMSDMSDKVIFILEDKPATPSGEGVCVTNE